MTSQEPLCWGIVGTGEIAAVFADALCSSALCQVAAVGSRTDTAATAFATQHGIRRAHASYEALFADPDVDAVYIATPHSRHAELAIRAAEARKHVLCEKPLAVNWAAATAMAQAAEDAGVVLMEALMYRFHPQLRALIELIGSGAIGEVHTIRASFGFATRDLPDEDRLLAPALAGGAILDVGVYPASIATSIAAAVDRRAAAGPEVVTGTAVLGPTGVDERAAAVLRYPAGVTAQIACAITAVLPDEVAVLGSAGTLRLDPPPWISTVSPVRICAK